MRAHYCDLCDCPIHGKKYILAIIEEETRKELKYSYNSAKKELKGKELCETCYNILMKLFSSRKKGLSELIQTIEEIFKMNCKNKDDKKK